MVQLSTISSSFPLPPLFLIVLCYFNRIMQGETERPGLALSPGSDLVLSSLHFTPNNTSDGTQLKKVLAILSSKKLNLWNEVIYKLSGKEEALNWAIKMTPWATLQNWSAKETGFSAAIQKTWEIWNCCSNCALESNSSGDQKTAVTTVLSRNLFP